MNLVEGLNLSCGGEGSLMLYDGIDDGSYAMFV